MSKRDTTVAIAKAVDAYRVWANDPDDLDIELLKAPLLPGTSIVDAAVNFARARYEDEYRPPSQSINVRYVNGNLHTLTIIAEPTVDFFVKVDEPGDSLRRAIVTMRAQGYNSIATWLQPYATMYHEVPAKRETIRNGIEKAAAQNCGPIGDILREALEDLT